MKYIEAVIICLLLTSCYDNDDYHYGGYSIDMSYSGEEHSISLDKEADTLFINDQGVKYLVNSIKYIDYYGVTNFSLIGKGGTVISPFVFYKETRFDKKYILIVQKPFSKDNPFIEKYSYPQYSDSNYRKFADVKIWYWVINKIDDIIYGPYTKNQYLEKRKLIGISDSLKFRFEEKSK